MTSARLHLIEIEDRLREARQQNDLQGEVNALGDMATLHMVNGHFDRALDALDASLILATQQDDHVGEAQILNNIGVIYQERGAAARAKQYFSRALVLWQRMNDEPQATTVSFNLATVEYQLGNLEEAARLLALVVAAHQVSNHPELATERAALDSVLREIELRDFEEDASQSGD